VGLKEQLEKMVEGKLVEKFDTLCGKIDEINKNLELILKELKK